MKVAITYFVAVVASVFTLNAVLLINNYGVLPGGFMALVSTVALAVVAGFPLAIKYDRPIKRRV